MSRVLAAGLLLLGVAHNQAHKLVPAALAGMAWNITGHVLIAALLVLVALSWRTSPLVVLVCALLGGYTLQVAGCAAWWLADPWPLVPGGELCSDRLGLPLGTMGLAAALLVAAHLSKGKP